MPRPPENAQPADVSPPRPSDDPGAFPADIPRLPGCSDAAFSTGPDGAIAWLRTSLGPDEVARFHRDGAERAGFRRDGDVDNGAGEERMLLFSQGPRRLRVDVVPDPFEGGSEVFLQVFTTSAGGER